jgi:hypothetical protein
MVRGFVRKRVGLFIVPRVARAWLAHCAICLSDEEIRRAAALETKHEESRTLAQPFRLLKPD